MAEMMLSLLSRGRAELPDLYLGAVRGSVGSARPGVEAMGAGKAVTQPGWRRDHGCLLWARMGEVFSCLFPAI